MPRWVDAREDDAEEEEELSSDEDEDEEEMDQVEEPVEQAVEDEVPGLFPLPCNLILGLCWHCLQSFRTSLTADCSEYAFHHPCKFVQGLCHLYLRPGTPFFRQG